ncbi:MAG: hypothetical protein ACOYOJ_13235 [Alsobacter sp.]
MSGDPFLWLLLVRMVLTAAVIAAASVAVERSGPVIGALIATLPVSAGPALVFIAMDHGADFLSAATLSALPASAATVVFVIVYVAVARRHNLAASLCWTYAAWATTQAIIAGIDWSFAGAVALNGVLFLLGFGILRVMPTDAPMPRAASRRFDVLLRAAAVMTVVAVVTVAARWIGPGAAGIAALVPAAMTTLIVLLHARVGGPAAANVIARTLPGMVGFTTGLAAVHVAAVPLGAAAALGLGLSVCVGWNLVLLAGHLRTGRRAAGG